METVGKICNRCKEFRLFEFFHKAKNGSNGYYSICKPCKKITRKIYIRKNKEELSKKQKEYYKLNKVKVLEKSSIYGKKNRKTISEKQTQRRNLDLEGYKLRKKQYRERNREKILDKEREYRRNNKEKVLAKERKYREENKSKVLETKKNYYSKNQAKCIANAIKYKLQKIKAVPSWADLEKIKFLYIEAKRLTLETGILHVVDHVIPLRGKTVCGLHIHTNLRIITYEENASKSNKFIEELIQ